MTEGAPVPSQHDEVGTTRLSRNCAAVDYWCCPFGAHSVAAARFGRHVATCRANEGAPFRATLEPCLRCATHLVAHGDAATHAERCGTPCPEALRTPPSGSEGEDEVRCLPCRGCGAAVRVDACRCAWCALHQPFVLTDPADIALLLPEYNRVLKPEGDGDENENEQQKVQQPPQKRARKRRPHSKKTKTNKDENKQGQWGQWE